MKQLTTGDSSSSAPRWSPDGKKIAFHHRRPGLGDGSATATTKNRSRRSRPAPPPGVVARRKVDRVHVRRLSRLRQRRVQQETRRTSGKQQGQGAHRHSRLLYKHWDEWRDVKRTHVFVVSSKGGTARDLTTGDFDSPPYAASAASITPSRLTQPRSRFCAIRTKSKLSRPTATST